MLGWILLGAFIGGVIIAITVETVQDKMREEGVRKGIVTAVNKSRNRIKFRDLENYAEYEMEGEVSDEIYEGQIIYA